MMPLGLGEATGHVKRLLFGSHLLRLAFLEIWRQVTRETKSLGDLRRLLWQRLGDGYVGRAN